MGMVLGAAFGGEFTNRTAMVVGTRNLLLASGAMVILAYLAFRLATSKSSKAVKQARAAAKEETDFSFGGMFRDIGRTRHLQVIVGIMVTMYLVDTLVEYQFQVSAKSGYTGDELTAFFGRFYGFYLNITEFVFQLFVTAWVVRRFGVGGTLQVAPVSIILSSLGYRARPQYQLFLRRPSHRSLHPLHAEPHRDGIAVHAAAAGAAQSHQGIYRHLRGPSLTRVGRRPAAACSPRRRSISE